MNEYVIFIGFSVVLLLQIVRFNYRFILIFNIGVKVLKCYLCDYIINDKSNFRRYRRFYIGSNFVNVLKCGKCLFLIILFRKFREYFV